MRFRNLDTGEFVAPDNSGVPPVAKLPRLLAAAEHLEKDTLQDADIAVLLHGGSSLGGARPKAHVVATDGNVAIAKFPSVTNDEWDVTTWEKVTLELAERAGITVPRSELVTVASKNVLVLDRFDRLNGHRIGYVSVMTMLEASDGDRRTYIDIAEVIERESPAVEADLRELWRRIVFAILVSNTDNHLRNHGFLRSFGSNSVRGGWSLSPIFDVNPNPQPGNDQFATPIDEDGQMSLEKAMELAPYFRLSPLEARRIADDIRSAVSQWPYVARQRRLPESEISLMEAAFGGNSPQKV